MKASLHSGFLIFLPPKCCLPTNTAAVPFPANKKCGKCSSIGLCSKSGRSQGFRVEKPPMFLSVRQQYTTWIHTTKWHITQRSRSPWALRCLFVCTAPSLDTSFRRSRVSTDVTTNIAIQIGSIFTRMFFISLFCIYVPDIMRSSPQFNTPMLRCRCIYLHINHI